jgi:phenylpropionate dioxygenase-like ring-hydroxylating dioxygenase large terminal subunit
MAHILLHPLRAADLLQDVFEGHIASQYLHNVGRPDIRRMGTAYGEAHLDSEASYFGPSFMINWLHNNYGGFKAESILINCHYPVTQDSFVLQWGVIVEKPKGLDDATTEKLADTFTEGVSKGFLQDVEIWKHKTRIDNPLLVEEDGAVYQSAAGTSSSTSTSPMSPGDDRPFEKEIGHHGRGRDVERRGPGEPEEPGSGKGCGSVATHADHDERAETPDVSRLARSMLELLGHDEHHDHDEHDDH